MSMRWLKNGAYTLLQSTHRQDSIKRLKKIEARLPDTTLRFAIPASYRGLGHYKWLKFFQHPEEIYSLYRLILQEQPRNVVEIGTARGGTLYLWLQAARDDARVVSIDLPGGKFGGGYRECRIPFYQSFRRTDQQLHLMRCNEHCSVHCPPLYIATRQCTQVTSLSMQLKLSIK